MIYQYNLLLKQFKLFFEYAGHRRHLHFVELVDRIICQHHLILPS